ncbi:transcriptional regulator [Bacillus amyloliquefaciens EGD-AQ14]|nr:MULTISPECIES: GyrI-like domain-containing protein [Bacillus amyloliquefaciens group]ERH57874.1 transcriptional regulator [Bacillus amyloliquefaciens EGD-AQ14]
MLKNQLEKHFNTYYLSGEGGENVDITIEELPESRIAYFRNVGEYGGKQNKELMESFKNWAQLNGLLDHSVILGIPQDHPNRTPKEKCRYDVCLVINQDHVPEPARIGTFSGGKYAVFLLDHTKEAVSGFWNTVFSEIEKNNLSIREQPIIERYTLQKVNHHLCEILIPIQ